MLPGYARDDPALIDQGLLAYFAPGNGDVYYRVGKVCRLWQAVAQED